MSEQEYQPKLDDELLSAYLDDELSAEERAAVEARLANDPEAQHLLHQLRSVSQSVQMLPLESAGRDLSADILQRIEAKKRGDRGSGGSAAIGGVTPRLMVFGSRRSWIWATLAVAAGLMIMVLERGDEKGKQLPAVAQNDRASADRSGNANRALDERADTVGNPTNIPAANVSGHASKTVSLGAPAGPSDSVSSRPPEAAPPADGEMLASRSRELAAGPPGDDVASSSTAASDQPVGGAPGDDLRKSPMAVGGAMRRRDDISLRASGDSKRAVAMHPESKAEPRPQTAAGESSIAAAKPGELDQAGGGQAEIEGTNPLVVVHVWAKPAAIRGGEFEKLLARNGVSFDENGKAEEAPVTSELFKKSAARSQDSRDASRHTLAEKTPVDMVVVDAPRDVVAACMADLQQDESNFASVEVDQPTKSGETAAATTDVAKRLRSELRQYNRGIIADKSRPRNYFNADSSANKDRAQLQSETIKGESNRPAGNLGASLPEGQQLSENQRAAQVNRGRALRVQIDRNDDQELSDAQLGHRAGGFGGGGGGESETARRKVVQQQKSQNEKPDEVRVLFMLRAEAPSAEPTKKAAE